MSENYLRPQNLCHSIFKASEQILDTIPHSSFKSTITSFQQIDGKFVGGEREKRELWVMVNNRSRFRGFYGS